MSRHYADLKFPLPGSSDNRYNQSFIVQQSAQAGMPIIAVSINYRLSSWGFLYGQEVQDSGNTMLGFRDQRLALQWVQEVSFRQAARVKVIVLTRYRTLQLSEGILTE